MITEIQLEKELTLLSCNIFYKDSDTSILPLILAWSNYKQKMRIEEFLIFIISSSFSMRNRWSPVVGKKKNMQVLWLELSKPECQTLANRPFFPLDRCLPGYIWPVWLLLQQKYYYLFHLQVHLYNIMYCHSITFSFYRSKSWPWLGLLVRTSSGMTYNHCNFRVAFRFLWSDRHTLLWR